VRRGLVCGLAILIFVPAAAGATPAFTIEATTLIGAAPLSVTFTAKGDAAAYHWDFGDGTSADGITVEHTFAAGRWTATASGRSAAGETATQSLAVAAYGLSLSTRNPARYGRPALFRGAIVPAERGLAVTLVGPRGKLGQARTAANGTYTFRAPVRVPGSYNVTSARASSEPLALRVVPKLVTKLAGSGARGTPYYFTARVVPAGAGIVAVKVNRGSRVLVDRSFGRTARIKLDTQRLTTYRIRVEVQPAEGYGRNVRLLRAAVVLPRLAYGARSVAVAQLGHALRALRYAAPATAVFDGRMLDAVYAFQKVQGLARTGVVDARFWRLLAEARTPRPRYAQPADHIEVNKPRQVLFVVRRSRVTLIVPISTAGLSGTFTPVGRYSIYRKVNGFDPSPLGTLYDPMYFTGGYAIHGNPSVPPFPASHGCVRVPMWLASVLYADTPYGQTVYVY
jgi:peptidoglycan hydrolase-like protein with peptidoglycan-binding domain